jgi:subtilisin
VRPAWSDRFEAGRLRRIQPVPLGPAITSDWAWGGATGRGVRVAVLDSGIDPAHADVGGIQGGVAIEADPVAAGGVRVVEGPHVDLFGHGTACAGIIRRAAPESELYSIRVLGGRLSGKGVVLAAGLRWALDNEMHVLNLSLGTGKRDLYALFHELADEAFFRGVMLVCAANNLAMRTYPAEYASVFSVAAHEWQDPFRFNYNPSPPIEFGAPGIDVEVAWLEGSRIRATGNSFAAPHLTGLIARILSKHAGLTPFQMKAVLLALADNARV